MEALLFGVYIKAADVWKLPKVFPGVLLLLGAACALSQVRRPWLQPSSWMLRGLRVGQEWLAMGLSIGAIKAVWRYYVDLLSQVSMKVSLHVNDDCFGALSLEKDLSSAYFGA